MIIQSTVILPMIAIPFQILFNIFRIPISLSKQNARFMMWIFGWRSVIVESNTIIKKGFILPNHRSFFDFIYEVKITDASILGRRMAFIVVSFLGLLCWIEDRCIIFTRNRLSRQQLFGIMEQKLSSSSSRRTEYKNRIVVFPEGTRLNHLRLSNYQDAKRYFRYGILKSIYQSNNYPVQLIISKNKELAINEKSLSLNLNIDIFTAISKPIYPRKYDSFDEFVDGVAKEWYRLWCEVYSCT